MNFRQLKKQVKLMDERGCSDEEEVMIYTQQGPVGLLYSVSDFAEIAFIQAIGPGFEGGTNADWFGDCVIVAGKIEYIVPQMPEEVEE